LIVFMQLLYEYNYLTVNPRHQPALSTFFRQRRQNATPSDATNTCSLEPGLNQ